MHYNSNLGLKNIDQEINTGDIIIVEGKPGFLTRLIKLVTGSGFTHTAMLVKIKGVPFVVETRAKTQYTYNMMPADWWFERYGDENTYIGKMPNSKTNATEEQNKIQSDKIKNIVLDPKESVRPYRVSWLALVYILQDGFGSFRPCFKRIFGSIRPMVCSTMIQEVWERAGIIERLHFQSPGGIVKILGGRKKLTPINFCKSQKVLTKKGSSFHEHFSSFSIN